MTNDLDPNPKNQLGTGALPVDVEKDLLAEGYVFACKLPPSSRFPFGVLVVSKRPVAEAVAAMELDDPRIHRMGQPLS